MTKAKDNPKFNISIRTYKMVLSYEPNGVHYFETKKRANRWLKKFCNPLEDGKYYKKNKGTKEYAEVIWDYHEYRKLRKERFAKRNPFLVKLREERRGA
tara:strand:+ start:300 stop:596 length:297 start_codon:yes stop_codon:yes gene_type:complete